jgi:hypothetical protein
MTGFAILTNRKRTLIALIHCVVFLGVAVHGLLSLKPGVMHGSGLVGDYVLLGVYSIVASILAYLVSISRGMMQRLYFALCTSSASFGLLRTIFGDPTLPVAQYLRVAMLVLAVAVGTRILRSPSTPARQNAGCA